MSKQEIKRACCYCRVSTTEQAVNGYSIEEQEKRCRAAIAAHGWEDAGVFSDPGVSGRTMERPGLEAMLEAIERGDVDAVVIYKLDRLSRKQRDTMELIEDVFLAKDVTLVSLSETLDTSTPWGRAMIGILSSFAQMESETIQARTSMGRKAKAEKGGYAGGKPPYGYRAVNGVLTIVPEEAEVVRLVFALREDGETLKGITEYLNEHGYRTKRGKEFLHSAIQVMLGNEETYRGIYRYGDGPKTPGQHEAILPEREEPT